MNPQSKTIDNETELRFMSISIMNYKHDICEFNGYKDIGIGGGDVFSSISQKHLAHFRQFLIMSWCLTRTGRPLFVSLFNPLTIVISVVIGVIFLHEVLYFGSVAGAVVLVTGFYAVIWGKAKERKINVDSTSEEEVSLLQDGIEQA